jgi:hypothetical protein
MLSGYQKIEEAFIAALEHQTHGSERIYKPQKRFGNVLLAGMASSSL